jgi:hypothetical protein
MILLGELHETANQVFKNFRAKQRNVDAESSKRTPA